MTIIHKRIELVICVLLVQEEMSIAKMLQELIDNGLSQTEIEKLTDGKVQQSTISKILSGHIKNVWNDKAEAINSVYWKFKKQKAEPEQKSEA